MTDLEGRYRLGEVLGRGGVADVYRARDLVLDRDVAVKVLRDSVDDTDRNRFVDEATMLARLSHPGIVTVLDAGISGAQPFLVMELVEGPTLAAELRAGPMPHEQVVDVGAQLASAVAFAHEQGAVHRDVKPANVLLGAGAAKLADFGIARLVGDTMHHTQTGTTVGTPAYVSPEQVRGETVGPPTDVYSLGLVLLEALAGERAFPGTPTEAALARLHRSPAIPATVPADWRELLTAMTATDPAARPSAADAAARLRALGSGVPIAPAVAPTSTMVLETAPTGATGPTSGGRRTATAVGVVAAAALAIVVIAVAGGVLGNRDEDPTDPATTPATTSTSEPVAEQTESATDDGQDGSGGDQAPEEPPAEDKKDKGGGKDKNKDKGDKGKGGGKGKGKG